MIKMTQIFHVFSYDIEITSEVTGRAPTPELTIGVKQSGNFYFNILLLTIILLAIFIFDKYA